MASSISARDNVNSYTNTRTRLFAFLRMERFVLASISITICISPLYSKNHQFSRGFGPRQGSRQSGGKLNDYRLGQLHRSHLRHLARCSLGHCARSSTCTPTRDSLLSLLYCYQDREVQRVLLNKSGLSQKKQSSGLRPT